MRLQWFLALACLAMAYSNSACSNHGPWKKAMGAVGANARKTAPGPSNSPSDQPADASTIAGNWVCSDSQCDKDTIKSISAKLDAIDTIYTEYLPAVSPGSICRVREKAQLTITDRLDENTSTGIVTHNPLVLLNTPANTMDCADLVAKINQEPVPSFIVTIVKDKAQPELTINGVRYTRVENAQLQAMNIARAEKNAQNATVAGEWDSIEPGLESLKTKISGDLLSMTTESTIEFEHEKCLVREVAKLRILDDTDPMKLYATKTPGTISLVDSPENTPKCAETVDLENKSREQKGSAPEQITLERDGNQKLIIVSGDQSKRFVRKKEAL